MESEYTPFGIEWEKEMSKLPKSELILMYRLAKTGTNDAKIAQINSRKDAQRQIEGIINDFEAALTTKDETVKLLGEYTARIESIFYKNMIKIIKENPELLK